VDWVDIDARKVDLKAAAVAKGAVESQARLMLLGDRLSETQT
jgi:hypothetical protein